MAPPSLSAPPEAKEEHAPVALSDVFPACVSVTVLEPPRKQGLQNPEPSVASKVPNRQWFYLCLSVLGRLFTPLEGE